MTASKVQVAQRPSVTLKTTTSTIPLNVPPPRMPPAATTPRRCLFGTPDPKELQEVWERGMDRERQRMLKNYGFDVKTDQFVTDKKKTAGVGKTGDVCKNNNNKKVVLATPAKSSLSSKNVNTPNTNNTNNKTLLSPRKSPYRRLKHAAATKQTALTGEYSRRLKKCRVSLIEPLP